MIGPVLMAAASASSSSKGDSKLKPEQKEAELVCVLC